MRRLADQFMLRMPDGMRELVRERAEANRRSMNAEIIFQIERAYLTDEARATFGAKAAEDLHRSLGD